MCCFERGFGLVVIKWSWTVAVFRHSVIPQPLVKNHADIRQVWSRDHESLSRWQSHQRPQTEDELLKASECLRQRHNVQMVHDLSSYWGWPDAASLHSSMLEIEQFKSFCLIIRSLCYRISETWMAENLCPQLHSYSQCSTTLSGMCCRRESYPLEIYWTWRC